jgi:hypothetical protein
MIQDKSLGMPKARVRVNGISSNPQRAEDARELEYLIIHSDSIYANG